MAGNVLIYVEHDGGRARRLALEAATTARRIAAQTGGQVVAVALGAGAESTAEALGRFGVNQLLVSSNEVFDQYLAEPQADFLAGVFQQTQPQSIIFPYTQDGKDIGSRLAARLGSGMVAAVTDLAEQDGVTEARESVFGGQYTVTIHIQDSPAGIYFLRPNAFQPAEQPVQTAVQQVPYSAPPNVLRARKGKVVQEEGAPTPLEEASVIVSGGRGLGGPEPFALLEQLAAALGGVVGASRAAVDAGWISYPHQVGQTGRTVKPQLYIAVGISGAVQHRVGMQTADIIIAINRDQDAPIFQLADLGVVGNLFEIVPALTAEIKRRKEA